MVLEEYRYGRLTNNLDSSGRRGKPSFKMLRAPKVCLNGIRRVSPLYEVSAIPVPHVNGLWLTGYNLSFRKHQRDC
jgi:hypothetical protein